MIVREFQIDQFGGWTDVHVPGFPNGLCAIYTPHAEDATALRAFLPSILFGNSFLMELPEQFTHDGEVILELEDRHVRIRRDFTDESAGHHRLGKLCIEAVDQRGSLSSQLEHSLRAVSQTPFESIYSDALTPLDRIESWRQQGLLNRFRATTTQTEIAAAPDPTNRPDTETLATELHRLTQQRDALRTQTQRHGNAFQLLSGLYKRRSEAELQTKQLQSKLAEIPKRLAPVEQAIELFELWAERKRLENEDERPTDQVDLKKTLRQVQRLDEQIESFRHQIQTDKTSAKQTSPDDAQRLQELKRIRHRQAEALAAEISINTAMPVGPVRAVTSNSRSAKFTLAPLRPMAQRLRTLRDQLRNAPKTSGGRFDTSHLTPQQREEYQAIVAEIARLKRISNKLLERRLLPVTSIIGLGLLFSGSLSMVATACLLDLGQYKLFTLALGIVGLFAALMLRKMGERPPVSAFTKCRQQIQELVKRATALLATNRPYSTSAVGGSRDRQALLREYRLARQDWHDALRQHQLPPDLSPRELVHWIKRQSRPMTTAVSSAQPFVNTLETNLTTSADRNILNEWLRDARRALNLTGRDSFELDVTAIGDQLDSLILSLSEKQSLDHESIKQQLKALQDELKQLKKKRQAILEKAGVASIAQLQTKMNQTSQTSVRQKKLNAKNAEIEAILAKSANPAECQRLLETHSAEELFAKKRAVTDEQTSMQDELKAQQRRFAQIEHQITEITRDSNHDDARLRLAELELQTQATAAGLLAATVATTSAKPTTEIRTQQISSPERDMVVQFISSTTGWSDVDIVVTKGDQIQLRQANKKARDLLDFPAALQSHIINCLQLVLAITTAPAHESMPLILGDPWWGKNSRSRTEFIRLLNSMGQSGRQVLFITSSVSNRDAFQQNHIPVLSLYQEERIEERVHVVQESPGRSLLADEVDEKYSGESRVSSRYQEDLPPWMPAA